MFDRATLRQKALPILRASLGGRGTRRPRPAALYPLLRVLMEEGVELDAMRGPWLARSEPVERSGRSSRRPAAYVERDLIRIQVDTEARARQLAGFLNWCEVEPGDLGRG